MNRIFLILALFLTFSLSSMATIPKEGLGTSGLSTRTTEFEFGSGVKMTDDETDLVLFLKTSSSQSDSHILLGWDIQVSAELISDSLDTSALGGPNMESLDFTIATIYRDGLDPSENDNQDVWVRFLGLYQERIGKRLGRESGVNLLKYDHGYIYQSQSGNWRVRFYAGTALKMPSSINLDPNGEMIQALQPENDRFNDGSFSVDKIQHYFYAKSHLEVGAEFKLGANSQLDLEFRYEDFQFDGEQEEQFDNGPKNDGYGGTNWIHRDAVSMSRSTQRASLAATFIPNAQKCFRLGYEVSYESTDLSVQVNEIQFANDSLVAQELEAQEDSEVYHKLKFSCRY